LGLGTRGISSAVTTEMSKSSGKRFQTSLSFSLIRSLFFSKLHNTSETLTSHTHSSLLIHTRKHYL
jgi:hypothetical protein